MYIHTHTDTHTFNIYIYHCPTRPHRALRALKSCCQHAKSPCRHHTCYLRRLLELLREHTGDISDVYRSRLSSSSVSVFALLY